MKPRQMSVRLAAVSRIGALGLVAGLLLVACSGSTGTAVPQAWIDAPLHESTHPVAPMEIVMHAAAVGGVAEFELSIDDEVLARRPPDDTISPLVEFKVQWDPPHAGDFALSVRAQDHSGAWGPENTSLVSLTKPEAIAEPGEVALVVTSGITPTVTPTVAAATPRVPTLSPAAGCVDRAKFLDDVTYPDDTQVTPGSPFTKIWRLRNDGTCAWNEEYKIVFVSGDGMNNATPLSMPAIVPPGATLDVALDLVAPIATGTYKGNYQIRNPQGVHFGVGASGQTPFYVQIVVESSPGITPTAAPPPPPDTRAPSVSVSHSPGGSSLPTGSSITFSANAGDNVGVARIDIWVTAPGQFPVLVKTCNNTTGCSFTGGPYTTQGNLSYFAVAADAAGNETNSGAGSILIYVVIS